MIGQTSVPARCKLVMKLFTEGVVKAGPAITATLLISKPAVYSLFNRSDGSKYLSPQISNAYAGIFRVDCFNYLKG